MLQDRLKYPRFASECVQFSCLDLVTVLIKQPWPFHQYLYTLKGLLARALKIVFASVEQGKKSLGCALHRSLVVNQLGGSAASAEGSAGAGLRNYGRQATALPEARTLSQKAARLAHVNELRRIKEAERRQEQLPKQTRGGNRSRDPPAATEKVQMDAAIAARRASGAAASTSGGVAPSGHATAHRPFGRGQGAVHARQALQGQEGVTFPGRMQEEEFLPSLQQHGPVGVPAAPPKTAAPSSSGTARRVALPLLNASSGGGGPVVREEVLVADAGVRESFIDDIMGREAPAWAGARAAAALAGSVAAPGRRELVAAGAGGGTMGSRSAYPGGAGGASGSSAGATRLGGGREEGAQLAGRVLFPSALGLQGRGPRSVSVSAEQVCVPCALARRALLADKHQGSFACRDGSSRDMHLYLHRAIGLPPWWFFLTCFYHRADP